MSPPKLDAARGEVQVAVAPEVIGFHLSEGEEEQEREEAEDGRWRGPEAECRPKPAEAGGAAPAGCEDEREKAAEDGEDAVLLEVGSEGTPSKNPERKRQAQGARGDGQISAWAAMVNLITCMIGASVLSLPHIVAQSGWVLGPIFLAFAGFVSCWGCLLVDRAIDATEQITGVRPHNIGEVAEASFGPRGKTLVVSVTCLFQVAKCGVYLMTIGTNLHFWGNYLSLRQCTLAATVVCLRLVFLRDITVISRCSVVGVVASVLYLITIAAGGFRAAVVLPPETRLRGLWPARPWELPAMFAVMLYTYSPADVLPVLKSDMRNPKELPAALCWSHAVVAFIYVGLGTAGYFGWGRGVAGNVLLSMCDYPGCPGAVPETARPGSRWSVGFVLSGAVVCNLMVTVPVVLYCVFRVLEAQCDGLKSSSVTNACMRVAVLLSAVSVAIFMPFFVEVLSVLSTGLIVTLQIFLPVAVTFALSRRAAVRCGLAELGLLVLGCGVFVAGMSTALRNLAQAVAGGAAN